MLLVDTKIFKKKVSERGPRIKTMRKDLGEMKLKLWYTCKMERGMMTKMMREE
jgi:hypothetical protein